MLANLIRKDSCVICGNGKSVICDEVLSGDNDVILINTGIFLNIDPVLYIYERIGLISGDTTHAWCIDNYLQDNFDFEAIQRIIFYEMGRTAQEAVEPKRILVNPNPSILGFLNPLPGNLETISTDFFSFNEEDKLMYGHHLLHYFRHLRNIRILNFRGSIIRAYSAALMMGYQTIYFAGLNPSEYVWWWELKSSWQYLRPSVMHLVNHFKSINLLRPPHLDKYDNETGAWSSAPMTWCLRKTVLASKKAYDERQKRFPKLVFLGADQICLDTFNNLSFW